MTVHLRKNQKEVWCGTTKRAEHNKGEEWAVTGEVSKGTCSACFKNIQPMVDEPTAVMVDDLLNGIATDREILDTLTPRAYEPRAPLAHWQLAHLRMSKNGLLDEITKLVKEVEKLEFTPEGKDPYWAMSCCKEAVRVARLNFRQDVRNAK